MSYRDIQKHVADMYGLEISDGAITNITDKLLLSYKHGNNAFTFQFLPNFTYTISPELSFQIRLICSA